MINETDSEEDVLCSDSKMVLIKFPVHLLQEMDDLSRFNCIERSEFIIFAASQLLDYMERKVGVRATSGDNNSRTIDYELESEDVFEAAEDADE